MLTKSEAEGCRKLLDKLDIHDIKSLVDTVTSKRVTVFTKQEGIKAILTFTSSAVDLLKRKKITKDVLFKYLGDVLTENNEIGFSVPSSKNGIIKEILSRWGTDISDNELMDIDLDLERPTSPDPSVNGQNQVMRPTSPQIINVHNVHNITHVYQYHQPGNNSSGDSSGKPHSDKGEFTVLGEKFAQWFYENLNSFCPTLEKTPQDFGPHHFWDDCFLIIQTWTPELSKEEIGNATLIADRLLLFPKKEQMLFNPNLTKEGIYVKSNVHGLVQILVCGTLHRGNECLGIFQQLFGIIKDPRYDNNWKIKMSKLCLKAMQSLNSMPKLEGNPEHEIVAMSSDLQVKVN